MSISELDRAMMRLALEEADLARAEGEIPVGAVVCQDDRVVSRGHNLREATGDPTAHAEIVALRRAAKALGRWRLTDLTLYVTLEPCPMCAGAVVQGRVGRVVFGAHDPQAGCCGSVYRLTEDPAFNHFARAEGGVLEQECAQRLSDFLASERLRRSPAF